MRDWLRPPAPQSPRDLLLLTLVSVSALAWLGWRLTSQERLIQAQNARERLEQAADPVVAAGHGAFLRKILPQSPVESVY